MDEVLKDAIKQAEMSRDISVSWAFGSLRESIETLQAATIACVMRSPGTGFDGWRYLEKEHINKDVALSVMHTLLTASLELLKAIREK